MQESKDRLVYIDSLRGVMILFVMYYHVLWVCIKFKASPTVELFDLVCMQTFFFISGFVTFKKMKTFLINDLFKSLKKKIKTILIPTVAMFLLFTLYFRLDLLYYVHEEFKNGYWFTYVLFIISSIHLILVYFQKIVGGKGYFIDIIFILWGGAFYCLYGGIYRYLDFETCHYISLKFVMKYYIFFLLGYMLKKYYLYFEKILFDKRVVSILIIIAFIPFITDNKKGPFHFFELVVSISQVLIVFILFLKYKFFHSEKPINQQLALFGRHSMEIYFIHYFFLFSMPYALDFIAQSTKVCLKGVPGSYFIPEVFCILPVALALAYISIGVRKIVDLSPFVSKLFFGPIQS